MVGVVAGKWGGGRCAVVLWGMNGWFHAIGASVLARILFIQFAGNRAARGFWYSVFSTSQSVGAALTPVILSQFTHR